MIPDFLMASRPHPVFFWRDRRRYLAASPSIRFGAKIKEKKVLLYDRGRNDQYIDIACFFKKNLFLSAN